MPKRDKFKLVPGWSNEEAEASTDRATIFSSTGQVGSDGQMDWGWATGKLPKVQEFTDTMRYIAKMSSMEEFGMEDFLTSRKTYTPQIRIPSDGASYKTLAPIIASLGQFLGPNVFSSKSIALSPDGKMIATIDRYGRQTQVWDTSMPSESVELDGRTDKFLDMKYSPDGTLIASTGRDSASRIWDAMTGLQVRCFPCGRPDNSQKRPVRNYEQVLFSTDGGSLFTCTKGGFLGAWKLSEWEIAAELDFSDNIRHSNDLHISMGAKDYSCKFQDTIWQSY